MPYVHGKYIDPDDIPETGINLGGSNGITSTLLPDGSIDVTDCYEREE